MRDLSKCVRWSSVTLLATLPFLACGGGSSPSSSPSCDALQACCNKISDPSMATACMTTLSDDESLPMSDQTCAGSLGDYQSFCAGLDGGSSEGGATKDSGTDAATDAKAK